jgi:hypothetical protein
MKNSKTSRSAERAERRLVYMSAEQLAALKRLSKRTGTSQAVMFRRGIDLVLAEMSKRKVQS